MNVRTLLKEVEKLEARRFSRHREIPTDRVEFARALGVDPDRWQERLLRSEADRLLLNCSRQSGKSTMAALLALHQALTVPGSLVLCLAPALRQSQELFGKVLGFYRDLGRPIAADAEQRLGLELANRSRIAALPGSERTVRGYSGVDLLIVDEAARVDDALVYSIRPMLAVSGGRLLMLSTPYGKRGVFYEEWTGGEDWERFEIAASQCPRIPPAFLEAERRSMPEWWFAQEYGVEFREALDQLFTSAMIEGARADDLAEYRFEGDEELWNTA